MSALSCPVCQGAMREVTKEGVQIDTCSQCRGVWLDRGELEKLVGLVDRQATEPRSQPMSRRNDQSRDDGQLRQRGWVDDDGDDEDDRRSRNSGDSPRKSKMSRLMDFFD
jgi:uncharacterized protein